MRHECGVRCSGVRQSGVPSGYSTFSTWRTLGFLPLPLLYSTLATRIVDIIIRTHRQTCTHPLTHTHITHTSHTPLTHIHTHPSTLPSAHTHDLQTNCAALFCPAAQIYDTAQPPIFCFPLPPFSTFSYVAGTFLHFVLHFNSLALGEWQGGGGLVGVG